MSKEIDWSKAPEGATHFDDRPGCLPAFMKRDMASLRKWQYWSGMSGKWQYYGTINDELKLIARPAPWNGEGLPPVGTVCEIELITQQWVQVVIVAVTDYRIYCEETNHHECVDGPSEWCPVKAHAKFRPIRTPEQIAAEELIKERDDFSAVIISDSNGVIGPIEAMQLFRLGYRKVQP